MQNLYCLAIVDVMHQADHATSVWDTQQLHRLATDVPLIASVLSGLMLFLLCWICHLVLLQRMGMGWLFIIFFVYCPCSLSCES